MVRAEAGVDRRDLSSSSGRTSASDGRSASSGNALADGCDRSLPAEGRGLVRTDARGDPHARLLVHREAVRVGLAGPDRFVAPVRRRLRRRRLRLARRLRIAHRQLHLRRGVASPDRRPACSRRSPRARRRSARSRSPSDCACRSRSRRAGTPSDRPSPTS